MKNKLIFGAALGLVSASAFAQHHAAVTSATTTSAVASAIAYQPPSEQESGFSGMLTPASPPAKASDSNPHPWLIPAGVSLFAPAGFGADQNTVFAGISAVPRWPGTGSADGNAVVGVGVGNGEKYVGLTVATLIDSLGYYNHNFDQNGNVSAQLFRWFTPSTAVSVGSANAVGWGAFKKTSRSYYGSITQLMPLINTSNVMIPLAVTFGAGTGAFVSPTAFQTNNDSKVSMYGSAALGITKRMNLIADYTSGMWSSGVSFMPFAKLPAALTFYATNLGGSNWVRGPVTYGARLAFGKRFA